MFDKKRRVPGLKTAAPLCQKEHTKGYLTTLHAEGSSDGTMIQLEKRKLVRPEINVLKVIINVLFPVLISFIIGIWNIYIALVVLALYLLIRLQEMIIWFIHLYQRYAPEEVRLACLFEPSCSEYMILSLRKYGVFIGGIKGTMRLLRCHSPNGGIDYP